MKKIYTRKLAYSFLFCVALGFDLLGIISHIILIIQKKRYYFGYGIHHRLAFIESYFLVCLFD